MDSCWNLFVNAIKTEATREAYTKSLTKFKEYSRIKTYCQFKKLSNNKLKELLVSYIIHLKSKNLSYSTISLYLSSIELFLDMNEIAYPKKVIRKLLPTDDKKQGGERPYTTEEIKRMLSVSPKLRTKALIHFFSSTGIRPNALHDPIIKVNDLIELPDGCRAILMYKDSKEEYWSFLTQEATNAINNYIRSRRLNGEQIDVDSPLFENKGKVMEFRAIRHVLTRVVKNAGISRVKKGNRYDKALTYGFRKRFNTILKINNRINPNIAEKLMGHKRGLDGVYLKPTMKECHVEFTKAIPNLTVSDENRDKLKIIKLEKEKTTVEELHIQIKDIHEMQKTIADMMIGLDREKSLEILNKNNKIKEYVEFAQNSDAVILKHSDGSKSFY